MLVKYALAKFLASSLEKSSDPVHTAEQLS